MTATDSLTAPAVLDTGARPVQRTPYVHVMTGLPGSGKTTVARQLLLLGGGRTRRLSLDDLRAMADPARADGSPWWSWQQEQTTVAMLDACLREVVLGGYDAIVDATHLTPKAAEHLRTAVGRLVWFVVHDLTGVPAEECVERDAARGRAGGRTVGADVIHHLAAQHAEARAAGWQLTSAWLNEHHDAARSGARRARAQAALDDPEGEGTR